MERNVNAVGAAGSGVGTRVFGLECVLFINMSEAVYFKLLFNIATARRYRART